MRMRKMVFVMLVALFAFAFAGMSEALTIRLAGQNPMEHQNSIQMENFKKIIEEKTGGKINVKTYPAGQLGDYVLVYEEVSKGTIDMALISIPPQFDARQQIYFTPYLVSGWNELEKLFDPKGWLYGQVGSFHKKMDIKFLGFFMDGLSGLGLTKEPKAPLDPTVKKGVLCRIPNMEICKVTIDNMGYNTVSVPYGDLYTALQTGVAEGWYGGSAVHSYLGFRDVVKHYYPMNIYAESEQWVMNEKLWKSLTPDQQKLIESTIAQINKNSIKIAEKEELMYQKKMAEAGIKVHPISAKELQKTIAHVRKTVWPKLDKILGKELTEALIKEYASK